jgi:hypothetical protein
MPDFVAPRAGDVLLTADDSRTSRFIRWWTASRWSHAALVLGVVRDPTPGYLTLEVSPPALRLVDDGFYAGRWRALVRPPITEAQGRAAARAATYLLGDPYPLIALAGYALVRPLRGWLRRANGSVCSAAIASLLSAHAGIVWRDAAGEALHPRSDVSPDTISDQAEREGWAYAEIGP